MLIGLKYVLLEYYSSKNLSVISQVQWGKKILMVGGKTDPASDKVSGWFSANFTVSIYSNCAYHNILLPKLSVAVWAFDTETECWSLMEAKGDVPVKASNPVVQFNCVYPFFTFVIFTSSDLSVWHDMK